MRKYSFQKICLSFFLLATLIIAACTKTTIEEPQLTLQNHRWLLVAYNGGLAGVWVEGLDAIGYKQEMTFSPNGQYRIFKNNNIVLSDFYTVKANESPYLDTEYTLVLDKDVDYHFSINNDTLRMYAIGNDLFNFVYVAQPAE